MRPAPPAPPARGSAGERHRRAGRRDDGRRHRAAGGRSGARTLLHDPIPEALARGASSGARTGCAKKLREGRLSARRTRPRPPSACSRSRSWRRSRDCELVIEAVPERLELKHEMYATAVGDRERASACWRRNTSSLLVTAIAAAREPPRARGGHALLQPGTGDAPAGGRRRRAVLAGARWRSRRRPARRWARR